MRELKFRAWDRNKKKLHRPIKIFGVDSDLCGQADSVFWQERDTDIEFEHFEWMQFTGLTDKNDKEIYEGDIVEVIITNRFGQFKDWGPVMSEHLGNCTIEMDGTANTRTIDEYGKNNMEVIGNSYENPELILRRDDGKE